MAVCLRKRGGCKPPFLAASGPVRYLVLLQARWPCKKPGRRAVEKMGVSRQRALAPGRRRVFHPEPFPQPTKGPGPTEVGGLLSPQPIPFLPRASALDRKREKSKLTLSRLPEKLSNTPSFFKPPRSARPLLPSLSSDSCYKTPHPRPQTPKKSTPSCLV